MQPTYLATSCAPPALVSPTARSPAHCRFPGHPESVDAIVKFDEDTVITGSSDGVVRILNVLPNKLLGVVGEHVDMPIEKLALRWGAGVCEGVPGAQVQPMCGCGHAGEAALCWRVCVTW